MSKVMIPQVTLCMVTGDALRDIQTVHAIAGRTRIRIPRSHATTQQTAIDQELLKTPAVQAVRVNVRASCVVVSHSTSFTAQDLEQLLANVLRCNGATVTPKKPAAAVFKTRSGSNREGRPRVQNHERSLFAESLTDKMHRVAIASAVLPLFIFRRGALSGGLLRGFLTVPGLASLALSAPVIKSGIASLLRTGRPNADTLTGTGIVSSLVAGQDVSALAIVWLTEVAELLTEYTMGRTRSAIGELLSTGEETVWRLSENGSEESVPLEEIKVGDRIVVHTGEKICVDGAVVEGEAAVDQASISGEFMPLHKNVGSAVFGGTVVKTGRLTVRADKVGDDTAVARIVRLVEQASEQRSPIQSFADRIAGQLIPLHFAMALAVYLGTGKPMRALTMLVIDYSCSLRLSTATALSAAIYSAARQGVLIKGGNHIESLATADTLLLDKTGTVTTGKAHVTQVLPLENEMEQGELLTQAAAAESTVSHPLATAVIEEVKRQGLHIPPHNSSEVHVSRGVETSVRGHRVRVGSRVFMEENHIDTSGARQASRRLSQQDATVIYVARDQSLLGVIGIQDTVREGMDNALTRLRRWGISDVRLLTGDSCEHAAYVARQIGLEDAVCDMRPEDKLQTVTALREDGSIVVMVGDGMNDAPALAAADVGVVLGTNRTDVAVEAADVVIAGNDPRRLHAVFDLGSRTTRLIRQNFAIAIGVNSAGLVCGALGWLPLFWSVVLHNSSTLVVVLNSSRLLYHDLEATDGDG